MPLRCVYTSDMTTATKLEQHRIARTLSGGRWVALCIASVLLHWLVINWASGNLRMPSLRGQSDTVVTAALLLAPVNSSSALPAADTSRPKPKPKPKPKARHRPAPPTSATLADQAPPPVAEIMATETMAAEPDAGMEAPGTSIEPAVALPTTKVQAPEPSTPGKISDAPPAQASMRYKVSPPPSVELQYDVKKIARDGNPTYGHGTISWQTRGTNYIIHGDAGILFITALTFKSEGVIDDFGIAPVLYSEKRFRKSETNTHFQRERNIISFSASETSYPREGGEQDRASIIWQLSGIGRGDSEKFVPDAEFGIFVAGVRDGEIWPIRVIGQEDIEAGIGKINTWHVVRIPKPGSYDHRLDIWLAPQHEWYPVKLRYTEANGDTLDMLLSDMRFASAP